MLKLQAMHENYHQIKAKELGFPEGIGKRYNQQQLETFVDFSESRFGFTSQEEARDAWLENPYDPQVITKVWRTLFRIWGAQHVDVPDCDWSREEIAKPVESFATNLITYATVLEMPFMVYRPDTLDDQLLRSMFPDMLNDKFHRSDLLRMRDTHQTAGWIKVSGSLSTPLMTEEETVKFADSRGVKGLRFGTYTLATQAMFALTDHFFDEDRLCRLPGTNEVYEDNSYMIAVGMAGPKKDLFVDLTGDGTRLGARFEMERTGGGQLVYDPTIFVYPRPLVSPVRI